MHPAFLDNLSWEMAEVYGAITDQILINLARHFPFYQYVDDIPTSAFTYQAKMLAQIGQVSKETIQIIRNGLSDADLALQGVLEQAVIDAVKSSEPELVEAVKKGVFTPNTMPVLSPNQTRAFQLYYEQAANKLNLVNTVMLESTQSAYTQAVSDVVSQIEIADRIGRTQQALDVAAGETITGVSSWNAALKHATDRMKEGGVCGFIDHAGRRWSAEAYTAMDIRTTVFNTGRAAVWETNQNFGNDLYIVSYHNGARPLCYPYQNMVISRDDRYGVTYDLDGNEIHFIAQSATSYGQPAGLFGINCKHYPTPFIPGVSVIEGHPQDPDANAKTYEESQKQRELERKLREEKRDLMMAKAQGADEDEIKRLQGKCRETSEEIDDFCQSTGRARHRDREAVYTKREFPDADKYDVSKFETEQKELIDKFYQGGGEQQNYTFGQMTPNEPIVPEMPPSMETPNVVQNQDVATFNPAKSIEEAEAYAKEHFYDESTFGRQGVSYTGVSLDTANVVNKRLTEFFDTYDVEKFGGITAPAGNTKLGKRIDGANAAFGTVNRHLMLSRKNLKTPETIIKGLSEEKKLVKEYLADPSKFSKLSGAAKKILDASSESGRATVAENLVDVLNHELGHSLEKALRKVSNYGAIEANWSAYAAKISGYATTSFGEYIAESHCAWLRGETIDPELVKGFMALMR